MFNTDLTGDGTTPHVASAKRETIEFSKNILHQLYEENASDTHVKEQAISDFLRDVRFVNWRADPSDDLSQLYIIKHKKSPLFTVRVWPHKESMMWQLYDEDKNEEICVGGCRYFETAKRVALETAKRQLELYVDAYATDVLTKIRQAA